MAFPVPVGMPFPLPAAMLSQMLPAVMPFLLPVALSYQMLPAASLSQAFPASAVFVAMPVAPYLAAVLSRLGLFPLPRL